MISQVFKFTLQAVYFMLPFTTHYYVFANEAINSRLSIYKFKLILFSVPGTVTNFRVVLDPDDAQKFTLSFNCPDETQRNGRLKEYIVQKKHEVSSGGFVLNFETKLSFLLLLFKFCSS